MRAFDARGPMILIWQGYASDQQDEQTVFGPRAPADLHSAVMPPSTNSRAPVT